MSDKNNSDDFIPTTSTFNIAMCEMFFTEKKVILGENVIQDFIDRCKKTDVYGGTYINKLKNQSYIDIEDVAFKIVDIERNENNLQITIKTVDSRNGRVMNYMLNGLLFLKLKFASSAKETADEVYINKILFPAIIQKTSHDVISEQLKICINLKLT